MEPIALRPCTSITNLHTRFNVFKGADYEHAIRHGFEHLEPFFRSSTRQTTFS